MIGQGNKKITAMITLLWLSLCSNTQWERSDASWKGWAWSNWKPAALGMCSSGCPNTPSARCAVHGPVPSPVHMGKDQNQPGQDRTFLDKPPKRQVPLGLIYVGFGVARGGRCVDKNLGPAWGHSPKWMAHMAGIPGSPSGQSKGPVWTHPE